MLDFEQEMKLAYLEEAQALLDESESAFLALDAGDRSAELIDRIFRCAHNFKGSAKTVGFDHLSKFGHAFEDVLTDVKKGALVPDKTVCTVLLKTLDEFKAYVAGLKNDLSYAHDTAAIIATLQALGAGAAPAATPESQPAAAPAAAGPSLEPVSAPTTEPSRPAAVVPAPVPPKPAPAKAAEEENLKVNRRKLDSVLNLIGELVVHQSMITSHRANETLQSDQSVQTLRYIEKLVHEIQDISMSLRMTPISPLFQKLRRIARDASQELGKTIQFVTEGDHVEVDKTVMDRISDPLVHLVRNAVDHGIETDEERAKSGKAGTSTVTLSAQQQEDRIILTLADNGRGMNAQKLIAKAIEKGILSPSKKLTDQEAYSLIFEPGFSTKEQVTDLSGRGVGMDVVQRAINDLKGSILIKTELGAGTQFVVSLPLSMSILTGMVIGVDRNKYVVPLTHLVETIEYGNFKVETSTAKGRMINVRGEVIPVFSLSSILRPSLARDDAEARKREARRHVPGVITVHNGRKVSFEIDEIYGQQQIVLKNLGHEMRDLKGVVAGAILSSGEPGLVLNLSEFIEKGTSSDVA
jgi:two-component system chemotaxis sensor kinase CheA